MVHAFEQPVMTRLDTLCTGTTVESFLIQRVAKRVCVAPEETRSPFFDNIYTLVQHLQEAKYMWLKGKQYKGWFSSWYAKDRGMDLVNRLLV